MSGPTTRPIIRSALRGAPTDRARAIEEALDAIVEPSPLATDPVAAVAQILRGTKSTRFRPRPSGRSLEGYIARLPLDGRQPIRLLTMWGAIKHKVEPDAQAPDLAEVLAAKRVAELTAAIAGSYPGGVEANILLEDFGVWYQDAHGQDPATQRRISEGIARYCDQLRAVLTFFNPDVRISTLLPTVGGHPDAHVQQLEENTALFERYVTPVPTGDRDGDDLRSVGWCGGVKAATLHHYWRRLKSLYPDAADAEVRHRISKYLATVLLYEQVGWQRSVAADAIRVAFYSPSPGTPIDRLANRVHLRGPSGRTCSSIMPPWTSCGCLIRNGDGHVEVHVESPRALAADATPTDRYELILTTDASSISVPVAEYSWEASVETRRR